MVIKEIVEELDSDEPQSLEEWPLSPYELRAKEHWERFLPRLCRQLRRQSPEALDKAIRAAYHSREYAIGLTLAPHPGMHRMRAEFQLHPDPLFPPPERQTTPDPDRRTTR